MKQHKDLLLSGARGGGGLLSLLTWVMFGAVVVGNYVGDLNVQIVGYSLLSLTIVRMLPVSLSLLGMGVRPDAQLFLGWFGPRGLASIVFVVIVMGENVAGADTLVATVVCTVTLSILAHGLSANPFSEIFAARAKTESTQRS